MEENFFSVSEFSFGTVVGTVCLNLGTELRLRLPGLVNRCIFLIPKKVFIILPIETTGCFPKKGGLMIQDLSSRDQMNGYPRLRRMERPTDMI